MKSLELFSGMGGLAYGLEMAGANHSAFIEFNRDACHSLRENFSSDIVHQIDVRKFDFSQIDGIDIVAGGPPCQPFSLGGKHGGINDDRDMFPYAALAVEKLSPKAFIFENVKGLLRSSFSNYFEYIILRLTYPSVIKRDNESWIEHLGRLKNLRCEKFRDLKYIVKFQMINSADYGTPQIRERVVIVGIRDDFGSGWTFPHPTYSKEALDWSMRNDGTYWQRHKISKENAIKLLSFMENRCRSNAAPYGFSPPEGKAWLTVRDAIGDLPDPRTDCTIKDHVFQPGARPYKGHTGSDLDWPSKTIKAGGHGVPGGENMLRLIDGSHRYLTVLEAKRIQTFPDSYVVKGAWGEAMRQIGNAVPVIIGSIIGNSVFNYLSQNTSKMAG